MSDGQTHFEALCQQIVEAQPQVAMGKMMRSEAITYKEKVFAFYGRAEMMCFKLGREFDFDAHSITDYSVLQPFKTRPPMRDWFLVPDETQWATLANLALERMQADLD